MSEDRVVHVFWLRDCNRNRVSKREARLGSGAPVTLVAYTITADGIITYATSTCGGQTDTFNRKDAHNRARGRLKGLVSCTTIDVNSEIGPEASIAEDIMEAAKELYGADADTRLSYLAALASQHDLITRYKKRSAEKKHAAK